MDHDTFDTARHFQRFVFDVFGTEGCMQQFLPASVPTLPSATLANQNVSGETRVPICTTPLVDTASLFVTFGMRE